MKKLVLVRHAESENNAGRARLAARLGAVDDATLETHVQAERVADPALSATGRRQARGWGRALARRLHGQSILLVSSPMRRSLETALELAREAAVERQRFWCHGELYEVGGAYLRGRAQPTANAAQIESAYPVTCRDVAEEGWYTGHTGREPAAAAWARVERVVAFADALLASPEPAVDTVVVVSHGDLITRWIRRWLDLPWHRDAVFMHHNTGMTTVAWHASRGLLLHGVNQIDHLPPELHTGVGESWWRYASPDLHVERHEHLADLPPADAAALAELRRRELLAPEGKTLADYADSDSRAVHFVAYAAGQPVGYVQYDPGCHRLRQMVIDPTCRGRRLGLRLVRHVAQEARRHSQAELLVHAWTRTLGFYRQAGFEIRGAACSDADVPWQPLALPLD